MGDRFDTAKGLERMRSRTREAREHEATQIFNAVLSAATAKGHSAAIFAPSIPMDISDAETAKATKAMLEQAGFLAEWKEVRPTPDSEPQTVEKRRGRHPRTFLNKMLRHRMFKKRTEAA